MKKIILIAVLNLIIQNLFAQHKSDTTLNEKGIITQGKDNKRNKYFIENKEIKNLNQYLLKYKESGKAYKKSRNNHTATLISMGVGLGGIATVLISKSKETLKAASLFINLPALAGMIYFGIKNKQQLKKSIKYYNKSVSF